MWRIKNCCSHLFSQKVSKWKFHIWSWGCDCDSLTSIQAFAFTNSWLFTSTTAGILNDWLNTCNSTLSDIQTQIITAEQGKLHEVKVKQQTETEVSGTYRFHDNLKLLPPPPSTQYLPAPPSTQYLPVPPSTNSDSTNVVSYHHY